MPIVTPGTALGACLRKTRLYEFGLVLHLAMTCAAPTAVRSRITLDQEGMEDVVYVRAEISKFWEIIASTGIRPTVSTQKLAQCGRNHVLRGVVESIENLSFIRCCSTRRVEIQSHLVTAIARHEHSCDRYGQMRFTSPHLLAAFIRVPLAAGFTSGLS